MLYFSSLLKTNPKYSLAAKNLFSALSDSGEEFTLFDGAKDIWARDYMPVEAVNLSRFVMSRAILQMIRN